MDEAGTRYHNVAPPAGIRAEDGVMGGGGDYIKPVFGGGVSLDSSKVGCVLRQVHGWRRGAAFPSLPFATLSPQHAMLPRARLEALATRQRVPGSTRCCSECFLPPVLPLVQSTLGSVGKRGFVSEQISVLPRAEMPVPLAGLHWNTDTGRWAASGAHRVKHCNGAGEDKVEWASRASSVARAQKCLHRRRA